VSVNHLKAAREAAEAVQVQIQKDTREEIERIKTQSTFKVCCALADYAGSCLTHNLIRSPQQHEIEPSLRKPSNSGRNRDEPAPFNGTKDRFTGGSSEFPSTP
jgi:hypothetical protein